MIVPMTPDQLLALAAFAFVTSVTPGPNNLMLMASGTNFGFARTVPHMLGVSVGFTAMIVVIGLGLAGLFTAFPPAYTALKIVSCVYLLVLAWKIATAAPPAEKSGGAASGKPFTFLQAALFQWINPKAWTMALTAITAYAPADNRMTGLFVTAFVFGLINLPTVGSWTLAGAQLRRFLAEPGRLRAFNVTAAMTLIASLYPIVFDQHGA